MTAPVIGLTTYGRHETNYRTTHYAEWFAIPTLYVDAVRRAGGVPILLPPGEANWQAILAITDGVILIGGGDINPEKYGGNSAHPALARLDPERDASELELAAHLSDELRRPTLCICRGMQVANVALGGTLFEHIPDVVDEDIHRGVDQGWTVQPLQAEEGSRLVEIMGASNVATFSGHHQALKRLGEGLRAVAAASDGIIEAVELPGHPWFIGVQWHPEMTAEADPSQQRLFQALVDEARTYKLAAGRSSPEDLP